MAQKDKVKELVGKGLHSYHTKALQQIDRIEKKNKEQNHKISILSNELDNDYLTKTEEGSVVSLEHSKEGMVYLDELQGNTLVNYCTDGSKEMTLNGDIDVEGVSVTTTEGVDNGKVDIMCEGNTLVNLSGDFEESLNYNIEGNYVTFERVDTTNVWVNHSLIQPLKNGNLYTIIVDIKENTFTTTNTNETIMLTNSFTTGSTVRIPYNSKGLIKETFIANQESASGWNHQRIETVFYNATYTGKIVFGEFMILEGDWTNKEIPNYFKGMKSVGQDDTNGHKIEILSQNKNLFDGIWERGTINSSTGELTNANSEIRSVNFMNVKQGQSLTFSYPSEKNLAIRMYDKNKKYLGATELFTPSGSIYNGHTRIVPNNVHYMKFKIIETDLDFQLQVENGSNATEFKTQQLNKKEISLNEPLRAIGDIKDRFVKQGNKWYIERNCKQVPLIELARRSSSSGNTENYIRLCYSGNAYNIKERSECLCDTIKVSNTALGVIEGIELVSTNTYLNYVYINVYVGNVPSEQRVNEGVKRVEQLNPNLIYQLATPIYEEITDVELITYLDTTHISNNSTIPCNMVVKNSGYNAIIKPSTQYTVAFDTNKSGEVGINIGGAKVTTTNNVATITTPATLADDSLRLYGKGIKGSKVRLLEGDKTNWIPSHFEGMKSSFEDKLQDDGSYKMEILSNNKNLIDIERMLNKDNYLKGTYSSIKIPLKPNTKYYFKFNFKPNNIHRWIGIFSEPLGFNGTFKKTFVWNENIDEIKQGTFITDNSTEYYLSVFQPSVSYNDNNWYKELFTNVYENFIISQVDDNYMEGKSNKIQFSSIEPLRGVGDAKDRFVFKEGRLMIERNCGVGILDGTESWRLNSTQTFENTYYIQTNKFDSNIKRKQCFCDKTPYNKIWNTDNEGVAIEGGGEISYETRVRLNKNKLVGTTSENIKQYFRDNNFKIVYPLAEPTYEEIPFELQKIILEGYENGTLFFDTNIPPTSTITYAGETPIVKSAKLNRAEVESNTTDINDNIIPYLMDMDYRVVCLELVGATQGVSMARLFGGTYEMLKRDIQSNRLTREEYGYRLADYFNAGKLTEEQVRELEDLR